MLLEIDVQGGLSVKDRIRDAVLVFLLPPSLEELERRLRGRGTDEDEVIRRRLDNAVQEIAFYDRYDYVVINDDVTSCSESVLRILSAESLRRERTIFDRITEKQGGA